LVRECVEVDGEEDVGARRLSRVRALAQAHDGFVEADRPPLRARALEHRNEALDPRERGIHLAKPGGSHGPGIALAAEMPGVDGYAQPLERPGRVDRGWLSHLQDEAASIPAMTEAPERPSELELESEDVVARLVPVYPLHELVGGTITDVRGPAGGAIELDCDPVVPGIDAEGQPLGHREAHVGPLATRGQLDG